MAENLASDLRIEVLADQVGMTPRTFARAYRSLTGQTPAKSVEALRIETAKRILVEQPDLRFPTIAARCGFVDEERMRRAFVRTIGISPAEYKWRFGQHEAAE